MILRRASFTPTDGMGIVEADEAFAVRPMQGQRVVQPVRFCWRRGTRVTTKPTQMTAGRVDDQNLAVQVEEKVQRLIVLHAASILLSVEDNFNFRLVQGNLAYPRPEH